MILSDVSIRKALADGRIVIEPLLEGAIQPSSVDLRVDKFFRVFRNDTTPYIDPKLPQEDLTELVEVDDNGAFILHPGEFVLGSTLERVALPEDMVARLEGKSSLGRLGLLIHSSLPASEPVYVRIGDRLEARPIGEIVSKRLEAEVVAFDPETFVVEYYPITGWYEGPADRIFEVETASGRKVRVTAGHNLFTLDRDGELKKVRTGELRPGIRVAVPKRVPDFSDGPVQLDLLDFIPESEYSNLVAEGPAVAAAFASAGETVRAALKEAGYKHTDYYRARRRLPLHIARQIEDFADSMGPDDRFCARSSRSGLPRFVEVDRDVAWLLGMYVAEGYRRRNQFVVSNTDQLFLDRVERTLRQMGLPVYRAPGAITCCSAFASSVLGWLGTGARASTKRIPPAVFSWPESLLHSFLEGMVDGDGTFESTRISIWTISEGLVSDLLFLCSRLGLRAGRWWQTTRANPVCQVYIPRDEHKLLTSVPLPDRLLVRMREASGLTQNEASRAVGYASGSGLNGIERRNGRDAVRWSTLRRFRDAYPGAEASDQARLERLIDADLMWDEVVSVTDTGVAEPIYDIEVRPDGQKIQNFLAGYGGVFAANTAGFVDAGWDGHLTLELSNVANLPIAIYPGMRIGQISFLQMTTSAENPYGSGAAKSKYQGQRGPTPSRYYMNFRDK